VFLGLLFLLGGLLGKLRLISSEANETMDLLNFSMHELEEYKKKSLEKQAKLSRELQTERNRIAAERIPVFTIKPLSSAQTIL
jgi:signal transduction histidine kinase